MTAITRAELADWHAGLDSYTTDDYAGKAGRLGIKEIFFGGEMPKDQSFFFEAFALGFTLYAGKDETGRVRFVITDSVRGGRHLEIQTPLTQAEWEAQK